ncbi:Ig-like domain-containing protein [Cellvibrio japonicus]|uniref:Fibronectin type III domain protein n=1 Tax=Cellvibrio japonicus (strain Ueda107) TaxID=498211 RepID=B3PKS3_CELJU|nr:Ig-like domain-containing protein [Cellvibrio japonicus]ACE82920.1 fibronectin type III domain protein [Cellvibrio japonicus Ueda107]
MNNTRQLLFSILLIATPIAALAQAITYEYTYDELGRLTDASDPQNGTRAYQYDPAGNRTTMTAGGSGNSAPIANPDYITLSPLYRTFTLNPLANDSDADGDPLTIVSFTSLSIGHVTRNGNTFNIVGTFGPASGTFTYTIADGKGGQATATVYVTTR